MFYHTVTSTSRDYPCMKEAILAKQHHHRLYVFSVAVLNMSIMWGGQHFIPQPFGSMGYCDHQRFSVCPSVHTFS